MSGSQRNYPTAPGGASGSANITGGTIDGAVIGGTNPAPITGTTIEATTAVISSEIGQDILSLLTIPAGPGTIATQTYADNAAADAKVGGTVTLGLLYSGGTVWTAGDYIGPASASQGSQSASNVIPWITRVAGTLSDVGVQALASPGSPITITIYKSTGGNTISYSATALTFAVGGSDLYGSDTNPAHAVSLSAGDCVVGFHASIANWITNGLVLTGRFTPATAV